MGMMREKTTMTPDSYLSGRTRQIFDWYARGFLTEAEAICLIGDGYLAWAERCRR